MSPGAWSAELRSCRACRLDNPPENKICRACGSLMPTGEMLVMPSQPDAHAWGCPQCRAENAAHYEFCLGCGAARRGGGGAPVERRNVYAGNPATSSERSPVVLILVIVIVVLVGALGAGVALFLAR
ncbi:MAG TPA: zinc ribbon domain-containing protein [Polyangiaceae bacterium]